MRSARRGPAAGGGRGRERGPRGGRRGLGPRCPRLGPRQEARRPAARPNRLRARPPAGLPKTLPGRRARAGPGRCPGPGQVRSGAGHAGGGRLGRPSRLPRGDGGRLGRSNCRPFPGWRGGTPRESESKQSLSEDVLGAPPPPPFPWAACGASPSKDVFVVVVGDYFGVCQICCFFFFSPPTLRERITQERRGQEGELAFVARAAGGVGSIWGI